MEGGREEFCWVERVKVMNGWSETDERRRLTRSGSNKSKVFCIKKKRHSSGHLSTWKSESIAMASVEWTIIIYLNFIFCLN